MAGYSFRAILWLCVFMSCSSVSFAVVDLYEFDIESQRLRYHQLIEELRCPKCQNQNLSGSDSAIAQDLRRQLYVLLTEGKSDQEIKSFMVARYGDFVLYKPRLQKSTLVLWLLPIVLFLLGVGAIYMIVHRRKQAQANGASQLSNEEQDTLQKILTPKATSDKPK